MIRVVVMVAAIAAFFSAAVFFGGSAVGAWDDARIEPDTRDERPRAAKRRGGDHERHAARTERARERAKARWVASVNRLCSRAATEVGRLAKPTTPAETFEYLDRVVALNAGYNDAFAALRAPPGAKIDVARIVRLFRRDEQLAERLLAALRAGDTAEMRTTIVRLHEAAALESALLVALGARGCDGGLYEIGYSGA